MPARFRHVKLAHDAFSALLAADKAAPGTIEPLLLELVRLRASQINGCAYCIDLHARDARALGETPLRLDVLTAWREAACYTERERAALAWTEALTPIARSHASDEDYALVKAHFADEEIARLTYVIAIINAWNTINVAARTPERGPPKPMDPNAPPTTPS